MDVNKENSQSFYRNAFGLTAYSNFSHLSQKIGQHDLYKNHLID